MNKIIYKPKQRSPAWEYGKYAASFHEGCLGDKSCSYCYMRRIQKRFNKYNGPARLKTWLIDNQNALKIFEKELQQNLPELQKHGLFLVFNSDPCLAETINITSLVIDCCYSYNVQIKLLTKQTWWLKGLLIRDLDLLPKNVAYGFTYTGFDNLEPGAATNQERINANLKLHNAGFKTWGSFEPTIDFENSLEMIKLVIGYCDLFKIGLQSGKKYNKNELLGFINQVQIIIGGQYPIYFKDSLLQRAGINREYLPSNCVDRNFNL